jgi:hypothetical protein
VMDGRITDALSALALATYALGSSDGNDVVAS